MKKLILSVVLTAAFGFCFAPINLGKVPPGKIRPELTDEERGKQQNNTPQIGEVGVVPQRDNAPTMPETTTDPSGADTITNAMKQTDAPKATNAQRDLQTATETLKGGSPAGMSNMLIWALIFGGLGFGIIFGVRRWADKVVPEMPKKKKVTW